MDFTAKIIPIFFVLVLLANYFNFIGFWYILRTLPCISGTILRRRVKYYFYTMNSLYVIVIIIACIPGMRPLCTDDKEYPYVMNFAMMLFNINYVFHFYINCNKGYYTSEAGAEPDT